MDPQYLGSELRGAIRCRRTSKEDEMGSDGSALLVEAGDALLQAGSGMHQVPAVFSRSTDET